MAKPRDFVIYLLGQRLHGKTVAIGGYVFLYDHVQEIKHVCARNKEMKHSLRCGSLRHIRILTAHQRAKS